MTGNPTRARECGGMKEKEAAENWMRKHKIKRCYKHNRENYHGSRI
ncbi:MAG: hypothetical protein AB1556_05175 [Bacillota bacterium]